MCLSYFIYPVPLLLSTRQTQPIPIQSWVVPINFAICHHRNALPSFFLLFLPACSDRSLLHFASQWFVLGLYPHTHIIRSTPPCDKQGGGKLSVYVFYFPQLSIVFRDPCGISTACRRWDSYGSLATDHESDLIMLMPRSNVKMNRYRHIHITFERKRKPGQANVGK